MPIDYSKYPPDWKQIRQRILERARHKCEVCRVKNYATGYRDLDGKFYSDEYVMAKLENDGYDFFNNELKHVDPFSVSIKIVLTIAHLDHDPENWDVADERLQALCQRCHLKYDAPVKAKKTRDKKAMKDLFE